MASRFTSLLRASKRPLVFGMIHVPALPGTPKSALSIDRIVEHVRFEAATLRSSNVDGIILENMHDLPYCLPDAVGPEIVASMVACSLAAKRTFTKGRVEPALIGIQILAAANAQALAVAHVAGLDFIRAEAFVFSHVADEGIINACAGPLLRYRRKIGADAVAVITDVKKKHAAHSITADVSLGETAAAAEFFGAEGVIVTGSATGHAASVADLQAAKAGCKLPVLVGSGVTAANVFDFSDADALIIGSDFKRNGKWDQPLDPDRIGQVMSQVKLLE